jgi:hypothetical protein
MQSENGQTNNIQLAQNEAAGADYITELIPVYAMQNAEILTEYRKRLENFLYRLNVEPPPESVDPTADGQANTVLISHIEMTLDEMFFGEWETYDFKWSVIANEVTGSIILQVVHPVSGRSLRRTGAAAIQIMVDAVPEELKADKNDTYSEKMRKKRERNLWSLDPANKKQSALDMGFPKLKAECEKNAAQSLGKLFGRDLNRKKSDILKPLSQRGKGAQATAATMEALKKVNGTT